MVPGCCTNACAAAWDVCGLHHPYSPVWGRVRGAGLSGPLLHKRDEDPLSLPFSASPTLSGSTSARVTQQGPHLLPKAREDFPQQASSGSLWPEQQVQKLELLVTPGKLPHGPAAPCKGTSPRGTGPALGHHPPCSTRADNTRCWPHGGLWCVLTPSSLTCPHPHEMRFFLLPFSRGRLGR